MIQAAFREPNENCRSTASALNPETSWLSVAVPRVLCWLAVCLFMSFQGNDMTSYMVVVTDKSHGSYRMYVRGFWFVQGSPL